MTKKKWFAIGRTAFLSALMALFAVLSTGCSNDEPDNPSSSADNNSVTIKGDGSATGGAVYSKIDDTTFFLDYVKYRIVDSHLEIIGYDKVELPAEPRLYSEVKIDGTVYKTREIASGAFYDAKCTKITLPAGICNMKGSYSDYFGCFEYCDFLESVVLPASLETIGKYCFSGCSKLSKVVFLGPCPRSYWSNSFTNKPVAFVKSEYVDSFRNDSDFQKLFSEIKVMD
ncbi:MAG: leucine-rich repeat domain-containing protein [[Clostridium] fimetarium]|nr:leucine-rich repeat domain-containing protein [Alistipes timonensis]MCM1405491.1 leucine-rich repeat domain-containing protein [[Clostridium] fimetarium]